MQGGLNMDASYSWSCRWSDCQDSAPNPDAAVAAGRGLDGEQVSREDDAQRGGEYQSVVAARAPCSGRQSCWTLENMLFARKVANLSKK